jgi:hypothetical protein
MPVVVGAQAPRIIRSKIFILQYAHKSSLFHIEMKWFRHPRH